MTMVAILGTLMFLGVTKPKKILIIERKERIVYR
jgi:hypothetical protein